MALLLLAGLGPLCAVVALYWLHVPLGLPGRFVYLYSPLVSARLEAIPAAVLLALVIAVGVWLTASSQVSCQPAWLVLAALGGVGLAVWSYVAPPDYLSQHVFNMQSPSQDGAFLREAEGVQNVREYLRAFPQRARTPPEQMRGTRVVSNPPGATLLAYGLRRLSLTWTPIRQLFRAQMFASEPDLAAACATNPALDATMDSAAQGLFFSWALTALWVLAGPFLYALGRMFLGPAAAAVFAVCCLISPMTLVFTPGKDPAQLLSVALPLWLWFRGVKRGAPWAAGASGGVLILSCMVSLVHVWIAAIVAVATVLHARHAPGRLRAWTLHGFVPAVLGALLAVLLLYVGCGLNVPAAAWAVAQSQSAVTRGPNAMPLIWQMLGVPLFLLFAGPAFWAGALWMAIARRSTVVPSDDSARLGRYLLIGCAVLMLGTAGFTNVETPRLWLPFVPLLLLGTALQLNLFRETTGREARLLAALTLAQIVGSVLLWTLMDMRETELRLSTSRFFG